MGKVISHEYARARGGNFDTADVYICNVFVLINDLDDVFDIKEKGRFKGQTRNATHKPW